MAEHPGVLDLFAGAGGMALGFQAEGWRCLGAVERDASAAATFARTFRADAPRVFGGPEDGDVNNLPVRDLLAALPSSPALVVGGPPCQGFSRAGLAKQSSLLGDEERILHGGQYRKERNLLYRYFLAVVNQARPMAFVMENVPGMRDSQANDLAHRISREAAALGYNVRYFLLNSAWYGVPQRRWRLFIVGLRSNLGPHAIPTAPTRTHHSDAQLKDFMALPEDRWMIEARHMPTVEEPLPEVSVFDAIGDLPKRKEHLKGKPVTGDVPLPLRRRPSSYVERLRQWPGHPGPERVSGNWYRGAPRLYPNRDFPIFAEMAQGDNYPTARAIGERRFQKHLRTLSAPPTPDSEAWKELWHQFVPPYPVDKFNERWRKLYSDRPSWTLTAHLSQDGYSHIHYDSRQARSLTIREAARLQSFPDAMEFQGNYGDQFRQVGNAVPPLMSRAIARSLREQLVKLGALPDA